MDAFEGTLLYSYIHFFKLFYILRQHYVNFTCRRQLCCLIVPLQLQYFMVSVIKVFEYLLADHVDMSVKLIVMIQIMHMASVCMCIWDITSHHPFCHNSCKLRVLTQPLPPKLMKHFQPVNSVLHISKDDSSLWKSALKGLLCSLLVLYNTWNNFV